MADESLAEVEAQVTVTVCHPSLAEGEFSEVFGWSSADRVDGADLLSALDRCSMRARRRLKEWRQAEPATHVHPQHALVLIGSSANSESAESTLFVRDLQSEAVFKIQGVRV